MTGLVYKAVLTIGRMNPPTLGHEKLVERICNVAKMIRAEPMVFLTKTFDIKNPLDYKTKLSYAEIAFGAVVQDSPATDVFSVLREVAKHFSEVTLILGDDRKPLEYRIKSYNDSEFKFDRLDFVFMRRDEFPISSSLMRLYVERGDLLSFISGLPSALKPFGPMVFNDIKEGLLRFKHWN